MDESDFFLSDTPFDNVDAQTRSQNAINRMKMLWWFIRDRPKYKNCANMRKLYKICVKLSDAAKLITTTRQHIENALAKKQIAYDNSLAAFKLILRNHETKRKILALPTGEEFKFTMDDIDTWLSIDEQNLAQTIDILNESCQRLKERRKIICSNGEKIRDVLFKCSQAYSNAHLASHLNELSLILQEIDMDIMSDLAQKCSENVDNFLKNVETINTEVDAANSESKSAFDTLDKNTSSTTRHVYAEMLKSASVKNAVEVKPASRVGVAIKT